MSDSNKEKTYNFKAEITQLLDILVHSLYKEREIFLRELISNASDALTRIQFEMLTNQDVLDPEAELAIHIDIVDEEDDKWIVVKDSGIGMTRDELVQNLGTIAQSGAREFLDRIAEDEADPAEMIGQFGVGFYSVFMVAEEVKVVSRSYKKRAKPATWTSRGGDAFYTSTSDKTDRGTEIHVKLKKDAYELASNFTLKQIVKKYSDFVVFSIYVENEQANQQLSLWRKVPSEVTEDEYTQFYQQTTMDFEEPLSIIHLTSDAPLHVRALLYVPASRERSVLNIRKEPGLMLYSHNVLIQEYCLDLLPAWLAFVDGVVDSEDLPLNVSRESIQNTRILRHLATTIRKRVLRELRKLGTDKPNLYEKFWEQYSRILKEGLVTEPESKHDLLPLFRFYSSRSNGKLITLDEYVEGMTEDQSEIYYVLGEDLYSVVYSPHLDAFKIREIEVLFLVDPIDPFVAPLISEYQDIKLRNIDDASIELPKIETEVRDSNQVEEIGEKAFNLLVGRFVTTLGERVVEVRQSALLEDSPVRLVSPEDSPDRDMQRIYKFMEQEYEVPKKILEINRQHQLIFQLSRLLSDDSNDELIDLSIEQLYDSALVQEGLHPNPLAMLPRIQQLLEVAVHRSVNGED